MIYLGRYKSPIGEIGITATDAHLIKLIFDGETIFKDSKTDILTSVINQLDEYFTGKRKIFDIPIAQSGTIFQKSVWRELLNIPYGETRTYSQIAENIKRPNSYRAVGTANGNNQIPIIIPCHRVIGANNKLSGYAFGVERKQWLINHEKQYK